MATKKSTTQEAPPKPEWREAFAFWLKLGFISFGGPAGQIAIMHEFLVEQKRWISDRRFLHALNYCMVLPGPEAQQLATYIGWLFHGITGGLMAGILFILPSVFVLLGLSVAYVSFGELPSVAAMFYGLKPAIVAIILLAMIKIGKKSLLSPLHYGVAVGSFICIFLFNVSFPLIILGAMLVSFAVLKIFPSLHDAARQDTPSETHEAQYYLNDFSPPVQGGMNVGSIVRKILVAIVLWITPLVFIHLVFPDDPFWISLNLFFTKAALVTFGGAYAVLPYVAQESVEKFHWLSQYEMLDGLALGESTPGPLIMVLVFVGFMAGYNTYGGSVVAGTLGLLTTTYYTFLPCFLFIFLGAPVMEKTKENNRLKSVLSIITAAVVGVMLNLTLYFARAVIFPISLNSPDWFTTSWIVVSVVALHRFNVNMILWIFVSALAGLGFVML